MARILILLTLAAGLAFVAPSSRTVQVAPRTAVRSWNESRAESKLPEMGVPVMAAVVGLILSYLETKHLSVARTCRVSR